MPGSQYDTVAAFKTNAAKVNTSVVELKNLSGVISYALALHSKIGLPGSILAAPGLPSHIISAAQKQTAYNGAAIICNNLRDCLQNIAVGVTVGNMAVADTASVIMNACSEDMRLAAMFSHTHVIAVPRAKMADDSYKAEGLLQSAFTSSMHTMFISGCSRTSDIERVLTLGVHGPLELHVAIIEEE